MGMNVNGSRTLSWTNLRKEMCPPTTLRRLQVKTHSHIRGEARVAPDGHGGGSFYSLPIEWIGQTRFEPFWQQYGLPKTYKVKQQRKLVDRNPFELQGRAELTINRRP